VDKLEEAIQKFEKEGWVAQKYGNGALLSRGRDRMILGREGEVQDSWEVSGK